MTAFLNYNVSYISEPQPDDGVEDTLAQNGVLHSVLFYSQTYWRFDIVYHLTKAEYDALRAQFEGGKRDTYTGFIYDQVSPQETYTVQYLGSGPVARRKLAPDLYRVEVSVRGTKD